MPWSFDVQDHPEAKYKWHASRAIFILRGVVLARLPARVIRRHTIIHLAARTDKSITSITAPSFGFQFRV